MSNTPTCSFACTMPSVASRSPIVARDWRDDRIEELERENAALRARVTELEARLGKSSGNSSRPPSSDPPGTPPPALPKRTGRKRGGQPGHAKHSRPLVPP